VVLAVSQSKMEVEFGISLVIPAITCVAYFGRSNRGGGGRKGRNSQNGSGGN